MIRLQVPGSRRLSQHISEGDGIAIIARVRDGESARTAEAEGAKAVALDGAVTGIRESTSLPVLWLGPGSPVDADAVAVRPGDEGESGLETVLHVRDEDELEAALEGHDPEIFLLAASDDDDHDDPLASVLELLPDVPAGKLAIAEVEVISREEVVALERAGFDAVLTPAGRIGDLVGVAPPAV
jgi:NAD(P)H-dependent flavin oxidoreductase YrpB (nitropropane dioxygenase family)